MAAKQTTASNQTISKDQKLIEQLHEAHEMQRKLLELFWAEPTIILAIASGLVIASYYYIDDKMIATNSFLQLIRTFLVLVGAILTFASLQTAVKHRYWRRRMLDKIIVLESELNVSPLPLRRDDETDKGSWMERHSAEASVIGCLWVLLSGFILITIYNFVIYLSLSKIVQITGITHTAVGFWLQISGLSMGFIGALLLTVKEIKTPSQILNESGTYVGQNPHHKKGLSSKSKLAIASTILIAVGFLLQLIGMISL